MIIGFFCFGENLILVQGQIFLLSLFNVSTESTTCSQEEDNIGQDRYCVGY